MNPGKFLRGLRTEVFGSSVRVFEQSTVTDIVRDGDNVVVETPGGKVRADTVVLATNAYSGEWDITPKRLSSPMWVTEVETDPIDPERLAALGWTSRSGLVTQHNIMENYRLTAQNTIVFGVRRVERAVNYPLPNRSPDPSVVAELTEGFQRRFPPLADVAVARAWGGWIGITSTWLPVAGTVDGNVYYSLACNGHGLAQATYIGSLIADRIATGTTPDDLRTVWTDDPRFGRAVGLIMGRLGVRAAWALDRFNDALNGSKRIARRRYADYAEQFVGVGRAERRTMSTDAPSRSSPSTAQRKRSLTPVTMRRLAEHQSLYPPIGLRVAAKMAEYVSARVQVGA